MKKVGIFEETEYGLRLCGYLSRHLSEDVQIYRFSNVESYCRSRDKMDLYLMSHTFYDEIKQADAWMEENWIVEEDILFLTDHYEEGSHCRWDHPKKLVEQIESRWRILSQESKGMEKTTNHRVVAVYSPFPMELSSWVMSRMRPGSLYLGFEDIGEVCIDWKENREKDSGELCYYVRLREEDILRRIEDAAVWTDGRYILNASNWFFDFVGLREEDFRWLIPKLKSSSFEEIYLGIGNSVVPSLSFFEIFDHLILLDYSEQSLIHHFCERLVESLIEEGFKKSDEIECIRGRYS